MNFQNRLSSLLIDVAQLLDGWHQDGTAWSEWDESVRRRVMEMMIEIDTYDFHGGKVEPVPDYDPRTDPSTNWVLDYAIELEQIQESRNHMLVDEHGHKSPVLTRGTIIDTIWKYLKSSQSGAERPKSKEVTRGSRKERK